MNVVLLAAGGTGTRTGQDIPKQFICVDNMPIIIHTMKRLEACKSIDKIVVACLKGWEMAVEAYAKQFNITKLMLIAIGGDSRKETLYNALIDMKPFVSADDIVLITDANRPLISEDIVDDAIAKCREYGSACGVLPSYDSMYISRKGSTLITETADREEVFRGMGPDTAPYDLCLNMYEKYVDDDRVNTLPDMLIDSGCKIGLSKGSARQIKITTTEDIEIFKALLNSEKYDWLK